LQRRYGLGEELALTLRFLRIANAIGAAAIPPAQQTTTAERPHDAVPDREADTEDEI
jgi:hypothetical protein